MNDNEINIVIAEACGWRSVPELHGIGWFNIAKGEQFSPRKHVNGDGRCYVLPSYTTDLNAMHEAVLAQSQDWQDRFTIELTRLCGSHKLAVNASASKRAEAFLRTIGKWKD